MAKVVLKQTMLYSIGEIVPKFIAFILLPVYTSYLTPTQYGILSYTSSVTMFLYALSAFSLNSYVIRIYSELDNLQEKKKLLGNIFLFIGILNIFFFTTSYFLIPFLIKTYSVHVPWHPYFQYALLINFLDVFSIIPLIIYRVKQKANYFVLLSLSRTLLQLGLTYYMIVVLKMQLVGNYLGQLLPLVAYFVFYWLIMYRQAIFNINITQIKKAVQFAWPLLPGTIAFIALGFIDRVILERYVPMSQLGVYNVAYLLASSVNIVISSGYKALEPQIFIKYRDSDFPQYMKQVQSIFLLVVYSVAMLVTLFSQEIFGLMTSHAFYKGYLLVPLIMVGVIMTGQNVIFGGVIIAEKNTKIMGLSTIIGAVINIIFNLTFIPIWGSMAAAASVAISYFAINFLLYYNIQMKEKSIKSEFLALAIFSVTNFLVLIFFKFELSLKSVIIKSFIYFAYLLAMCLVYQFKLKNIRLWLRAGI